MTKGSDVSTRRRTPQALGSLVAVVFDVDVLSPAIVEHVRAGTALRAI